MSKDRDTFDIINATVAASVAVHVAGLVHLFVGVNERVLARALLL
jgi:hypothetical protein